MTSLRQHGRLLLFAITAVLIWAQYVALVHDQSHHNVNEDCVVCKIVQTGADKANIESFNHSVYLKSEFVSFNYFDAFITRNIWGNHLSRAPPLS